MAYYVNGKCGEIILENNLVNRLIVRRKEIKLRIIVYVVSVFLAVIALYPFFTMLSDFTGFQLDKPAMIFKVLPKRWEQLVKLFTSRDSLVLTGLVNSLIVTIFSTLCNIYFSALTAHAITSYKWKFRKIFSNFVVALMMIPTIVATGGFINLAYKFHMTNSLLLLILPCIASPISVVFMRLYLESTFPLSLLDSARIDGAGEFRIFNQIVLPIMKPAIATQAIFAFVSSWNDTFLPMVLLLDKKKFTLPIALILNTAMGEITIPIFVTSIPPILVFLFLSKQLVEGVQLGSIKL